jgi:hypothetical protein
MMTPTDRDLATAREVAGKLEDVVLERRIAAALAAERETAEAEIARLREGLREFAKRDCNCDVPQVKGRGEKCIRCRAAALLK